MTQLMTTTATNAEVATEDTAAANTFANRITDIIDHIHMKDIKKT